jgi:hypothetical protein
LPSSPTPTHACNLRIIEPQSGLPLAVVWTVAREALVRENRPDIAIEIDRLRTRKRAEHGDERYKSELQQSCHAKQRISPVRCSIVGVSPIFRNILQVINAMGAKCNACRGLLLAPQPGKWPRFQRPESVFPPLYEDFALKPRIIRVSAGVLICRIWLQIALYNLG